MNKVENAYENQTKNETRTQSLGLCVCCIVIALQIFIWHNIIVWYTANLINCQLTQHILPMMMLFTIKRLINTLLMFGLLLHFTLYMYICICVFSAPNVQFICIWLNELRFAMHFCKYNFRFCFFSLFVWHHLRALYFCKIGP